MTIEQLGVDKPEVPLSEPDAEANAGKNQWESSLSATPNPLLPSISRRSSVTQDVKTAQPLSLSSIGDIETKISNELYNEFSKYIDQPYNKLPDQFANKLNCLPIKESYLTDEDINDQFKSQNQTPLHILAAKGYKEIVYKAIADNKNPWPEDNCGLTPLHTAIIARNSTITEKFLDQEYAVVYLNKIFEDAGNEENKYFTILDVMVCFLPSTEKNLASIAKLISRGAKTFDELPDLPPNPEPSQANPDPIPIGHEEYKVAASDQPPDLPPDLD